MASSPRSLVNFDDWKFHLGDTPAASATMLDDTSWRTFDVPHYWSVQGEYKESTPGGATSAWLPTGIGWYRKSFDVTPQMLGRNVSIEFDGVFMDSTVWVNGEKLGTHPPILHLAANFEHMDPTLVSDPRWATDSQNDPIRPYPTHTKP